MLTADDFYVKYNGKAIDDDGAYGAQCVDGFRVFCRYIGIPPYPTKNNWADGYWYYRLEHAADFHFITGSENFKNGDWVIWAKGSRSHPSSHIAMYYNGKEFGQNQGAKNGAFSLKLTDFSDSLGALRAKKLGGKTMELPYGYSTQTVSGIKAKVYRSATCSPYILSAGSQTALKAIADFDSDKIRKEAVVNAGYFQMASWQSDPVGTHYGVEQDSRIAGYTQAPRQTGIIVFYQLLDGSCHVSEASRYWYSQEEVRFAITPYSVRVHEGKLTYDRSVNYGDKDNTKNTQTVLCLLGKEWCVAVFEECCPRDTVTFFQAFGNVQELLIMDSGGSSQMRAWTGGTMQTVEPAKGRLLPNVIALAVPNTSSGTTEVPAKPTEDDEQAKLQAEVQSLQAENKKLLDANSKMADKIKKALETLNQ